jgi:hypothetical protein
VLNIEVCLVEVHRRRGAYTEVAVLPSHKQMLLVVQLVTCFGPYRPSLGHLEEQATGVCLHNDTEMYRFKKPV